MTDADRDSLLLALGKAQVDAMFQREEEYAVDDSEFLPLVEVVIDAFEMAGIGKGIAEQIWEHAFDLYDRMCKEVDPDYPTAKNRAAHAELPARKTPSKPQMTARSPQPMPETLKGLIERVTYHNPENGFAVLKV